MTTMTYPGLQAAIDSGAAPSAVPELCRSALWSILLGRPALSAVRHPLGFFCLPVVREGDLGVCIHVWTSVLPVATVTTSTVHCHSWDLVSFVLYGRVTQTLLDVEVAADGPEQLFEVVSGDDIDELVPTGSRVRCHHRERRVTSANASYRLAAGQFHSSLVEGGHEAATVVLGRAQGCADLTVGPSHTGLHRVRREVCPAPETARLAQLAIENLDARNGVR